MVVVSRRSGGRPRARGSESSSWKSIGCAGGHGVGVRSHSAPEFDSLAARSGLPGPGGQAHASKTTRATRYGTCNSVVASDPTSLAPPASSTLPSGSRVAVWK